MTPKRLNFLCGRLGINRAGLARFAGTDPSTVYRWISEELPVPHLLTLVLEVMYAKGVTPEEAFRIAGIDEVPVFKAPSGRPRKKA